MVALVTGVAGSTQIVVSAGPAITGGLGNVVVNSASYGITIKSNGYTYSDTGMAVLGTNGANVKSGGGAASTK